MPEMAAGGLWSTPSDLARAAIEADREYAGSSHKVLSQALGKDMLTRQKANWGLGFEVEKLGATPRFDHFGVNPSFVSVLEAYRGKGQGIVIMTNGQQGEKLINEILRTVAHEYAWPDFQPAEHTLIKLDATSLKDLDGTYDQADSDRQDNVVGDVEMPGSVYYDIGPHSFKEVRWNDGKGTVYGFAFADFNGDGWPDIVAARSDAPNAIWFSTKRIPIK